MRDYLLAKLAHTAIVAACVLTLVFVILHLTGDPVMMLLPPDPSREEIEALTRNLGLDQPLHVQYWRFVTKLLRGDFGTSLQHQQPAMRLVMERLPASILLAVTALALAVALSVPLGIAAAARRGTALDHLAVGLAAELFKPGNHGSTFGGNPLACAAALATLAIIEEERLMDNAVAIGDFIRAELARKLGGLKGVREIRGKGLRARVVPPPFVRDGKSQIDRFLQ